MERELWRVMTAALKRLPRRWPRGAVYSNADVLAVLLWAALHDRAIDWACDRANWPMQAWRRCLPDQSTMSRRLRDPLLRDDLRALIARVQRAIPDDALASTLIADGKALRLPRHSRDPDAAIGWGDGTHNMGYKLHALIDAMRRVIDFEIAPMNQAECAVMREMIERGPGRGGCTMLADAAYDSNMLYASCAERGIELVAPRRKAHRSISAAHKQHPARLRAIDLLEGARESAACHRARRGEIERFFGELASPGGGLYALPPWVRGLGRVKPWVAAKLVIYAARRTLKRMLDA